MLLLKKLRTAQTMQEKRNPWDGGNQTSSKPQGTCDRPERVFNRLHCFCPPEGPLPLKEPDNLKTFLYLLATCIWIALDVMRWHRCQSQPADAGFIIDVEGFVSKCRSHYLLQIEIGQSTKSAPTQSRPTSRKFVQAWRSASCAKIKRASQSSEAHSCVLGG